MSLNPKQQQRLDAMPSSMRATYRKAVGADGGKPSRPSAVKAMCQECGGYERKVVAECTSYGCPLWSFRPYQGDVKKIEVGDASDPE